MARFKGLPNVKIGVTNLLSRADLEGLLTVESDSNIFSFIIEPKKYELKGRIMIVSSNSGYLVMTKEQAMTVADELYILAKDYMK